MKVITVYELLGLIKDGKAPKRVRRVNLDFVKIYKLNSHTAVVNRTYENEYNDEDYLMDIVKIEDEIEIIKEEKKIEELKIEQMENGTGNFYIRNEHGTKCCLTKHSKIMADKINELVRELNKIKKEGK